MSESFARDLTHSRVLKIAIPIVIWPMPPCRSWARWTPAWSVRCRLAAPIGAVGIGAIILTAIYWIFGFLRMGTTGSDRQALGAGDKGEVAALLTRSLLMLGWRAEC